LSKRKLSKSRIKWDTLTFRQKETRLRALEALNLMRKKGKSLTSAAKDSGTTARTIRKHTGRVIFKRNRKWRASRHDKISRVMTIFSNGRKYNIETRDSDMASLIARYNSALGHFSQTGDPSGLNKLRGVRVRDVSGRAFVLETRPSKIISILERLEEPDVPSIYAIEA
jgi:hypothetical protein